MGGNGVVDAIEDGQKLNHFFNDRYYAGYAVAAGETEEPSRLERETPSPTPGESLAMAGQFDGVVQTDGEDFRYKVGGLGGGQKVELGDRFDIALPQRPKDDNLRIEESTPSPGAKIAGISTVTGVPRAFVKAKPSPRRVTGDGVALQQGSGRVPQVGASRGSSGMEERAVTKTSTHLTTNIPLAYASPSNVESALRHMLADERSELVVDADRNRLQITGTEDEIKQAEALVSQLDAPTRQVLIKAKIIESNSGTVDLWAYTPPEDKAVKPGLKEGEQRVKTKAAPPPRKPSADAPTPQPEVQTAANAFSTFSLNVSDVSFKLAAASLEQGQMPDAATVRSEEFLNAFNYRDPAPAPGQPLAFAWERARYPFAHNRDLLRFSVQTAARGREPGRPLNLVLLLDNSGSMERADRVSIIRECLNVLAGQLTAQDTISVVTFARTARLWLDGVPGVQAAASLATAGQLTPEGGTNLEEAMKLAYATAHRHYLPDGVNRVVLLTDGAANLGNIDPDSLKGEVEAQRRQGIALDCFGIGWEGYNDDVLEVLSRNGDGRYGFVNTPQAASTEFAAQLAGALQVAASDVKVQVEFNPARVTAYRQIGYAKHQLKKEQFRDNTVDAAEIGAAESGNALYVVETNPRGQGPVATVRARFKVPATGEYKESQWTVPYTGEAVALDNASEAMRLAASASAFSEWLLSSPYAGEVTTDRLLSLLRGVPEVFGADSRPRKLGWMIREAGRIAGN